MDATTHPITVNDTKATLKVQYGDFSDALQKTVDALAEVAKLFCQFEAPYAYYDI